MWLIGTKVWRTKPPGPWLLRWYLTLTRWPRRYFAAGFVGPSKLANLPSTAFMSHGPGHVPGFGSPPRRHTYASESSGAEITQRLERGNGKL